MKKQGMPQSGQSARFVEAARKAEVDESGKKFERAFRKVVRPKRERERARRTKA